MCNKILSVIISVYPFTKKVSKKQYAAYSLIQLVLIYLLWHVDINVMLWFALASYTLSLPIMIHRYIEVFNAKLYVCFLIIFSYTFMFKSISYFS